MSTRKKLQAKGCSFFSGKKPFFSGKDQQHQYGRQYNRNANRSVEK
ncbi:MAG: hypothetical protein MK198_00070 [Gracilimonas sp.]|nr:hypothetical protein [Gracilimonas sp.]